MAESLEGRGASGLYELVEGNRNAFRAVFKEMTDKITRLCNGSWFRALEPAQQMSRRRRLRQLRGGHGVWRIAESV